MNEDILRAFIDTYAACTRASLKSMGMQSRNLKCMMRQQPPMYLEEDFLKLITEEGIGDSDVMSKMFNN